MAFAPSFAAVKVDGAPLETTFTPYCGWHFQPKLGRAHRNRRIAVPSAYSLLRERNVEVAATISISESSHIAHCCRVGTLVVDPFCDRPRVTRPMAGMRV